MIKAKHGELTFIAELDGGTVSIVPEMIDEHLDTADPFLDLIERLAQEHMDQGASYFPDKHKALEIYLANQGYEILEVEYDPPAWRDPDDVLY